MLTMRSKLREGLKRRVIVDKRSLQFVLIGFAGWGICIFENIPIHSMISLFVV